MAEKSIITSPISEVIGDADSIFINKDGALMQITKENLENAMTGDLINIIDSLSNELNTVKKSIAYQPGEVVEMPKAFGQFTGCVFDAARTILLLSVPMQKQIKNTPTIEYENFSINTWFAEGGQSKTVSAAPVSIQPAIGANGVGTNILQLRVTYESSEPLANIPKAFLWRFDNRADNFWRFKF